MNTKKGKILSTLLVLFCLVAFASPAQAIFGAPVNLGPMVNSAGGDGSPSITEDGLELYFHSGRPGGQGGLDIWMSTRASPNQAWSKAVNLGSTVNGPHAELAPSISGDGLELYFTDYSDPRPGGFGAGDIWMTSRDSRNSPWKEPVNLGSTVNSPEDEITPVVSFDGRELIFDSYRSGSLGASDLWVARRDSKASPWGSPEWLGYHINSVGVEHCPTITGDGLTLYFDRTPPGQEEEIGDLMVSRRASLSSAWGPAVNLGHSLSDHWAAAIAADGSTLYYTSGAPGGVGAKDIWAVPIALDEPSLALWESVSSAFEEYAKDINARNAASWLALWDDKGIEMVNGAAPVIGRSAIGDFATARFASYDSRKMFISVDEVDDAGSYAVARGSYSSLEKAKSSDKENFVAGWYLTVFVRDGDGSLKIYRDTVGTIPAPPPK